MRRCPSCGSDVAQDDLTCSDCGAPLVWTSLPTEEAAETLSLPEDRPFSGVEPASAPGSARFLPGAMLADRYRVVGLLGRGGMGEVYRADDLKLGQPVALKMLPREVQGDPERLARFVNEVRQALRVTHPNVCRVFDLGEVEAQHYLSMEYVDGEELASLLRRIGRLPQRKAVELARQLCSGLAAAHAEGVLHRDLKPANVMIDGRGRAKITDFGLAGATRGIRGAEAQAGTPAYMAPEQLAGGELSVKTDLYALGLLLYEMFTGRRAFEAASMAEMARLQRESTPSAPSAHVESLDPAVERAIMRCLDPDPAKRPESALALAAALPGGDPLAAALAAGETPSTELVAAAGEGAAMSPKLAAVLALGSVLLFGLVATLAGRNSFRAYVPMEKSPEILADAARQIIRKLGYTEPIYSDPTDTAVGYSTRTEPLEWIARHDGSSGRWERLRNPRQPVVSFWYRQSPGFYWPQAEWRSVSRPPVGRWNPFPWRTGEITVGLDLEGRLTSFALTSKRFDGEAPAGAEPGWDPLFELAGIESSALTPVEPRYQGFVATDRRAAWIGRLPESPELEVRIEAGSHRGRPVLFEILWPWDLEILAAGPQRRTRIDIGLTLSLLLFLLAVVGGGILARRNLLRGRADRRGALRLVVTVFGLIGLWELLRTHATLYGHPGLPIFILASALFYCAFVGAAYLALEPHARRIWPSMLVSWSRLVGGPANRWRDPAVGRSVLVGLLAGALLGLLVPLRQYLDSLLADAPAPPEIGSWRSLLGQRPAVAETIWAVWFAILVAVFVVLLLVLARMLVNRQFAAAVLAVVILVIPTMGDGTAAIAVSTVTNVLAVLLVLRFGLLALVAAFILYFLVPLAATVEWTAWHSQPAVIALLLVAALAAWGYRAATAGHRPKRPGA